MGCDPQLGGITVTNLISGKESYIEGQIPDVTKYKDQNFWGAPSVTPAFSFLFTEIQHGEDVELLLGFYGTEAEGRLGGHYVTLTGLSWTDANDDTIVQFGEAATLTFIDPATGMPVTAGLQTLSGFLRTDYGFGGNVLNTFIEAAVSESPVAEPEVWLMMAVALAALVWMARLRRASRLALRP